MKKLFLSLLIAGFLLPVIPTQVFAQEENPGEEVGDDTQYSYATVVSVSDTEIVVSEYDYEKDESVNVTYSLDPAIKLRNINSLKEIAVDDAVEIIYTVKDAKKVATALAVDKSTGEEPMEGGEEPTEQPETPSTTASTTPVAQGKSETPAAPAQETTPAETK